MENDSSSQNNILVRPKVSLEDAKLFVFDIFGLKVDVILELNGYDDKNFHILVNLEVCNNKYIDNISDCGYVLKIVNSLDSQNEDRFKAQNDLLVHLNDNNIKCPRTILTKDRKPFQKVRLSSGEHIVRMLEYISGIILCKVQSTSQLFYEVGVLAAKMDNALQSFDHPVYHKCIQWGLRSAPDILNYLYAIQDEKRKDLVESIIEEFCSRVLKIEDRLEKGLIHGDINEQNLIVEEVNDQMKLKAVIDFGDTHYTCYLYELAIAMTYMIFTSNNIDCGEPVLAGYSSVRSLPQFELELLSICIRTRFCQSLVLGAHGSLQDPGNEYILTTAKKGWELLERMSTMSEKLMMRHWGISP